MALNRKQISVLLVAFSDSIHTARWVSQLDKEKYDIYLVPSVPFKEIHPLIKDITIFQLQKNADNNADNHFSAHKAYRIIEIFLGRKLSKSITARFFLKRMQQHMLAQTIRKTSPSIVHTMETQQAGYLMSEIRPHANDGFKWIHSTWGIDLQYFQHDENHNRRLKKLFSEVDILVTEGNRDIQDAKALGYTGKSFIIPSVGGSLDFELLDSIDTNIFPSKRKRIILKGYEGDGRLASTALNALRKIKHVLKGYEVVIYSFSKLLLPIVSDIRANHEFDLRIEPSLDYPELLKLTAESRISITNNLNDGVPNTMLEAMALGSFPIQSNTAITEGWIEDGVNGMLTEPNNANQISTSIKEALTNDVLVNKAAEYNRELVRKKLNKKVINELIDELYSPNASIRV